MAARIRRWSIVLHDVQKSTKSKQDVFEFFKRTFPPKEMVIAEEPYNHQEGSHIHIFINMTNKAGFHSLLQHIQTFWPHGRVQLDRAYGTMVDGCKYLQDAPKDKKYDKSPLYYPTKVISMTQQQRMDCFFHELKKRIVNPPAWVDWAARLQDRVRQEPRFFSQGIGESGGLSRRRQPVTKNCDARPRVASSQEFFLQV